MRLDKFLSDCKILSRRECAKAVKYGRISINGIRALSADQKVDETYDAVALDGCDISYNRHIYIMLNKPAGYVSSTKDCSLPCITELLPSEMQKYSPFPCGRLDRDTLGLIIMTNDGDLSHMLLSPKRHVDKDYRFCVNSPLPNEAERLFMSGITLHDGYGCKSAVLKLSDDRKSGIVTLTEGKYHQIKRMMSSLGSKITYLERISFAGIPLDPTLERGQSRLLTDEEISILRNCVTKKQ